MSFPRASGILLHPSSLPARGGAGDFGPAAYEFVNFLAEARQSLWQILPLNSLGLGNSPYSSISAFAGNMLLISLERLAERGWLSWDRLADLPDAPGNIDFEMVRRRKIPLVFEAAQNFLQNASGHALTRFESFCRANQSWLDDFAVFRVLRREFSYAPWNTWPREIARREPRALNKASQELADQIAQSKVVQFLFFEQWQALRRHCAEQSIRIVGDIAIFVNYDSSDVWTHPELFFLDENLNPTVVSGVPPDYFSKTGQRWGSPLYRWDVMKVRHYDWWIERLRWTAENVDYIRLDHFRGFEQYWEIPANEPTAVHGRWVDGPKDALFERVRNEIPEFPFFAEDLGYITPEVHALRERQGLPRMAVMQFGFGDAGAHIYLPHRCGPDTVIYTGTHDTDTTLGWWMQISEEERRNALAYIGECPDGIHWGMIRAAAGSMASFCVFPMQDMLGLGSGGRMNMPSISSGNWAWRMLPGAATSELARKLAKLAEVTDRLPAPLTLGPPVEYVA